MQTKSWRLLSYAEGLYKAAGKLGVPWVLLVASLDQYVISLNSNTDRKTYKILLKIINKVLFTFTVTAFLLPHDHAKATSFHLRMNQYYASYQLKFLLLITS